MQAWQRSLFSGAAGAQTEQRGENRKKKEDEEDGEPEK